MKFVREEILIDHVPSANRSFVDKCRVDIRAAIGATHHPAGSGSFSIFPESGRKSGEGNGVRPIRDSFVKEIKNVPGWMVEHRLDFGIREKPGAVDAVFAREGRTFCVEWETGNISSCHRSLNKMALGLLKRRISAGAVIVPTRAMYTYLTDRVANIDELIPYLDLWKALHASENGFLSIFVVEHDSISTSVPRIRKGTDGRARS